MERSHIRLFIIMLISSFFIFSFSQVGPLAYEQVFGEPHTYEEGTLVGQISISGLTRVEARQKLASEALKWKETNPVTLEMKDQNVIFPPAFLKIDIPSTLNQVEDGRQTYFSATVDQSYYEELRNEIGTNLYENLLLDKLSEKVVARAKTLHNAPLQFSIYQYIEDGTEELFEIVSEYTLTMPSDSDLLDLVEVIHETELKPESSFSLLSFLKETEVEKKALNAAATAIYGAVLETNFIIKQRHISTKLPSYAELGKEASVNPANNHDFVFTNPNEKSYQLNMTQSGDQLTVQVLGYPLPNRYEISIQETRSIEPRTIVQFSELIPYGETKIKVEGQKGVSAEVYRYVRDTNKVIRKDFLSDDYYPPVNRVEVRNEKGRNTPVNSGTSTGNEGNSSSSNTSDQSHSNASNGTEASDSTDTTTENDNDTNNQGDQDSDNDVWENPAGGTKGLEK